MRTALAALLVVLAAPGLARAGDVAMVARDVPLGPRELASTQAPIRFNMVGLHWQGTGTVLYRTRSLTGRWSAWTAADADSGPDARSAEAAATRAWRDGNPEWVGASDRIGFRTRGAVTRLRAYYLWSRVTHAPVRTIATAGSPQIVSRLGWQANEKIVRAKPQYAPSITLAIVHHTVSTNAYTRAEAPAIVRGIETYHVLGNGWNDIGYNFLIDRYGTVYEGRGGGIDRNVVGAHSLGFNYGSVGVALIGTYDSVGPTDAQRAALVKLLAWRLDVAHLDPLSFQRFVSKGNPRFRRGAPVTLRAISGHRDTYFTDCPGNVLYGMLPSIAKAVAGTGLPKIYEPVAAAAAPEAVRFTARLSNPLAWTVTVADANGAVVGSGRGTGTNVDWTWNGVTTGPGPYRWTIEAPGARPASGRIGTAAPPPAPPPVQLGNLAAAPSVVTPAQDGSGATTQITFSLGAPAAVTALLVAADGTPAQTLLDQSLGAGAQRIDADLSGLPDGRYRLEVTATPGTGKPATAELDLVVDRTLSDVALGAPAISPNGDGVQDTQTITFGLAGSVPVQVEIRQTGVAIATLFDGQLGPGPQTFRWNGLGPGGTPYPDGAYEADVTVWDGLGEVTVPLPFALDTTPPTLEAVDLSTLRFRLSEPATVTLQVNGQPVVKVEPAGVFHVPNPKAGVQTVTAQARDAAGNVSQTLSGP